MKTQRLVSLIISMSIYVIACDDSKEDSVMAGEMMAGEMMAGEMMAGEMMAGEVMAGEMMAGEVMAGEMMAGEMMAGPEILGDYVDPFMTSHTLTETTWTMDYLGDVSLFHFLEINDEEDFLIARNDDNNAYFAGLYSRFDWTTFEETLWFCQTRYDAETEAAALETQAADRSAPNVSGCGDYPWSQLTPR